MTEREEGLTIEELAARVGVPVRTVRFYITEGLLPGPGARGRGASYGREHLLRLRLVRRLAERRVSIAEIRETLTRLSTSEVAALLEEEARRAAELRRTPPATSPRAYVAALLKHSRTDGPAGPAAGDTGYGGPGVTKRASAAPRAAPPPAPASPRPRLSRPRRGRGRGPAGAGPAARRERVRPGAGWSWRRASSCTCGGTPPPASAT